MPSLIGLGAAERIWSILPFFHINAQAYSLMTALANGYSLTISQKFRASTFWRDAAALGVNEVNVIGAMLAILARQPEEMFVRGSLRLVYAARTLRDGWLHTGDAGYLDADGDVVLVARYKEMIRRRGENIAPGEVEDALLLHPGVQQAAVVGMPSSLTEEDVVAAVVRRAPSEVDVEELRAWCAARLAPYKVPSRFVFLDAFPLTPTMRVAKDRLKAEIAPL